MKGEYLMAGQASELERLQLQARVWEPAGRTALDSLGDGHGRRALDVGCGAMGWLRILSEWVGDEGPVVGSDIDQNLLEPAGELVRAERLRNVTLVQDDLFGSRLDPASFNLVHARFQLAPLGRTHDQNRHLPTARSPLRPDPPRGAGQLLLALQPPGPGHRTADLADRPGVHAGGREHERRRTAPRPAARSGPRALRSTRTYWRSRQPNPYLKLPLQFATSLEQRLLTHLTVDQLAQLRAEAERELADPHRWATTFTLIQARAEIPA